MKKGINVMVMVFVLIVTLGATVPCEGKGPYPSKTIRLVVQYAPGGGWDSYGRAMAPFLKKYLPRKVNVIIHNKPGAGGRVGNTYAYKSKPDGYTMGFMSIPGAIVTAMFTPVDYDVNRLEWIHTFGRDPIVLFVKGDSKVNTFDDLKALAKKKTIKDCSTGLGDTIDVITTIILHKAGLRYKTISGYKGSRPATVGLIRGDGDFAVLPGSGFALNYVKSGELKPVLAISDERTNLYPNISSAGDLGLSPVPAWLRCVFAPPGTSKGIKKVLNDAFTMTLKDSEFLAWAKKSGRAVFGLSGEQTALEIKKEIDFFEKHKELLKEHLRPKK